jgi:hypothetical protein
MLAIGNEALRKPLQAYKQKMENEVAEKRAKI